MKLLKLHIENFRSLRNVTWEPGDLNVLIGPNAGGKSNLLKAIDLLGCLGQGRTPRTRRIDKVARLVGVEWRLKKPSA